jgi:hypothetical protein
MRALSSAVAVASVVLVACGGSFPVSDGGSGGGTASSGYELNDVSFLYPLPQFPARDGLLAMTSSGDQGSLLPSMLFAQLPTLFEGVDNPTLYNALRVVSLRVDPCFPGSTPPAPPVCRKQIRMVAQPLVQEGADGGAFSLASDTEDATVHLFYDLSDAQFDRVLEGIKDLKRQAGAASRGPLNVHPVMK